MLDAHSHFPSLHLQSWSYASVYIYVTGSEKRYIVAHTMVFLYKRCCSKNRNIFYSLKVLMDKGYSLAAIADKVKCSHSCVSRTLLRVKETGMLKERKRSGRP